LNRIEIESNRIESKLIRNQVELVPNPCPIEIESTPNVPGDFLFHLHSSHIIRVWYDNNTSGWFPLIAAFPITCRGGAQYLAIAQNSLKYYELKSHHHDNGNVLDRTSMVIGPINTTLSDKI
jgi:hypothetical protein